MRRPIRHIKLLLLLMAIVSGLVSCMKVIDHYDKICDYTVRLEYQYNVENSSAANEILNYINSLDEYLFDGNGILYAVNPLQRDVCTGEWVSEQMLPPGRYSVIAVGNRTGISSVTGNHAPYVIGQTSRDDMLMTLDASTRGNNGLFTASDRLYHGYRTFSVGNGQISRVRVDMVHSHLIIYYKIVWEGGLPAGGYGNLNVKMENAPSEYSLMPQFIYPVPQDACERHDPAVHDPYERASLNCVHHIPTVHNDRNYVGFTHKSTVFGQEATGMVMSYRLRNEPENGRPTTFTICDGNTQIANTVLLNDFFTRSFENLDHSLRQEYPLVFRINRDNSVTVTFATIEDWDEGGWIGF